MEENLLSVLTGLSESDIAKATAVVSDVLSGKTFYSGDKNLKTGTMTNRGSWTSTIAPGNSVTIPAGYHNGSGKVTASSISSPSVKTNSNVHADSWSGSVSGYRYYIFVYASGHSGGSHSPSVSNGSVVANVSLTTSDYDDGLYRDLGHLAVIKANSTGTVTISCKVGGNYYGGSRVAIVGIG